MKFKTIVIATLLTLISVAVFAQVSQGPGRRPGPGGPPPIGAQPGDETNRPEPLEGVKAVLSLSDTQVEALRALLGVQRESTQPVMENIAARRRAYEEIASQANPDATALGNALTALREAEAGLKAVHDKFLLDFEALLNPTQLANLKSIRDAAAKIGPLAALGLVGGGPQDFGGRGGPGPRGGPGGPGPRGGAPRP